VTTNRIQGSNPQPTTRHKTEQRRRRSHARANKAIAASSGLPLPCGAQAALLGAVVFAVTLPATRNAFVSLDDGLYLSNTSAVGGLTLRGVAFAFTSVSTLYWHPLAWLSHELDAEWFGTNPAGAHFTSVLLHAIAAGLLFLVLRKLGAGAWAAAGGALLWALHPLRVESFAWIAERKDVLCALFFIATVLAYLRYAERPSKPRYLAWIGFAALALMSKPVAVSLAPILLLLDYWPLRRNSGPLQLLKEKLPLLGITAAVMALTVYGQKVSGSMSHLADVPFRIRLENVPVSCARYIGKILWPVNLSCFYAYDRHPAAVWVAACALGLCAVSALLVRKRRRRPWLLVGWIWFLVALLPNIGLLQAGRQSIADRFTNLAMIGIAIAAVFAVSEWVGVSRARGKAAAVSACAALAVMAALTMRQIGFWHDSARLCQHAISVEDGDYVRALLGATLISEHRYQEAEPHLRIAVRLAPERAEHHNNLANVLLETGQLDEAAAQESIALRLAPNDVSVAETIGRIDFRQANYGGAVQQFSRAVELGASKTAVATALNDMGASVASRGRPGEAEPLIREAIELNPSLVQARRNLVLVLADQGRRDDAAKALNEATQATGTQAQYRDLLEQLGPGRSPNSDSSN
jgi:Flp pilus assembly protein TadD